MKRATANTAPLLPTVVNFNPRPREEGDDVYDEPVLDVKDFNPRPREEGDLPKLQARKFAFAFQSTPS